MDQLESLKTEQFRAHSNVQSCAGNCLHRKFGHCLLTRRISRGRAKFVQFFHRAASTLFPQGLKAAPVILY